jgi:cell division ATPase FtsA
LQPAAAVKQAEADEAAPMGEGRRYCAEEKAQSLQRGKIADVDAACRCVVALATQIIISAGCRIIQPSANRERVALKASNAKEQRQHLHLPIRETRRCKHHQTY